MPGNLISLLANFLASHLILICLFGFVLTGLRVFGVWEEERVSQIAPVMPAAPSEGTPVAPGSKVTQKPKTFAPKERPAVEGMGTGSSNSRGELPATPRAPRLIGGSLPIYSESRAEPAAATNHLDPEGVFRPPVVSEPMIPVTRDQLLQQARRAFWNGDFEGAEAIYMTVIAQQPGDPDAFGELGNLYEAMGKADQALDAFFEAGVRLKALGETEKLKIIMGLFEKEGDPRAQQLAP